MYFNLSSRELLLLIFCFHSPDSLVFHSTSPLLLPPLPLPLQFNHLHKHKPHVSFLSTSNKTNNCTALYFQNISSSLLSSPLKCIREEVETLQNRKKQRLEEGARDKDKDRDTEKDRDSAVEKEKDDLTLVVPFSKCLNTFFGDEIVEMRNPTLGPGILGPAKRTTSMGG